MASLSDEFALVPPRLAGDVEEAGNSGQAPGHGKKKMAEFRILLQDNTLHALQLPAKCTGSECMDEVKAHVFELLLLLLCCRSCCFCLI